MYNKILIICRVDSVAHLCAHDTRHHSWEILCGNIIILSSSYYHHTIGIIIILCGDLQHHQQSHQNHNSHHNRFFHHHLNFPHFYNLICFNHRTNTGLSSTKSRPHLDKKESSGGENLHFPQRFYYFSNKFWRIFRVLAPIFPWDWQKLKRKNTR